MPDLRAPTLIPSTIHFKRISYQVVWHMPDHPLHQHYQRALAAGVKPDLAKLTIARRSAAAVLSMWKHQEVYDPDKHYAQNASAS